ncbi:MAG: ATP-dependent RNA helicase HrpA [Phycisphaerales bacterium]
MVDEAMLVDQRRLRSRLRDLREGRGRAGDGSRLEEHLKGSIARRAARRASRPRIEYPHELPISQARGEIAEAIRKHQVVVVCGETGSGKTTQLPKICLELGGGIAGTIGHTQPRRIAARAVAGRIAEELGTPLGKLVGYKVRFGDKTSPENLIKVMTDGVLLAETQSDRLLEQYDTIIVDEAHERSLNIDFLLGYLKLILPKRRDLKVIVTSATIDPERFVRHFEGSASVAPIIRVSGRTYPVEVLYRPAVGDEDGADGESGDGDGFDATDLPSRVCRAVDEASAFGHGGGGDMLVFLSGEREIRECAEALRRHHPPQTRILPLYARLSVEEQNKVFEPHSGRRIVLSTNVAETSLTVPGIRFVIDTGEARVNRYSPRTRVQRLEVEAISRASADQRKGRCGRLGPGVCVRLYANSDFDSRPEFTDPEIVRTNLASVILQMMALGLGKVEDFPFVEPPDSRMVRDGYETLRELGAVTDEYEITEMGRRLARLPIDPRLGRMIVESVKEHCLSEVLVIAAALSTQDPRDRRGDQAGADLAHARFKDENSDFWASLNLWKFYREHEESLSRSKMQKLCKQNCLSWVRLREWGEVWRQLHSLVTEMGFKENPRPATPEAVHRAILSGLLTSVGRKGEQGEFSGTHGTKFLIHPASGVYKSKPKWVVAAELVRTTKLYARGVARIEPEWIERLAENLVKRSYSDPYWDEEGQRVMALETVTLFGLEIASGRRVHYGPVDPVKSRDLFIHGALVEGTLNTDAKFLRQNQRLQEEVEALEEKSRKRDVLVDQQTRFAFYDARIPQGVFNRDTFEAWRKTAERDNALVLIMTRDDLMLHDAANVSQAYYPDHVEVAGSRLNLEYELAPGEASDGVTMNVPLEALNQVDVKKAEWLVPGLLAEKVEAILRAIPKSARRHVGPPGEASREIAGVIPFGEGDLRDAIRDHLFKASNIEIPREFWDQVVVPVHLRMNFRVVDERGKVIAHGRDLDEIKRSLGHKVQASFSKIGGEDYHRDGVTTWDFGDLAREVSIRRSGMTVVAYPGLEDLGSSVGLRVFETPQRAEEMTRAGMRRLFQLRAGREIKHRMYARSSMETLATQHATLGPGEQFKSDLMGLITERAFGLPHDLPRTQAEFEKRLDRGYDSIARAIDESSALASSILTTYQAARLLMESQTAPAFARHHADIRDQIAHLLPPGFLLSTPAEWTPHMPRFLAGVWHRLNRMGSGAGLDRDGKLMAEVVPYWNAAKARMTLHERAGVTDASLTLFRWMVEEYRVSLFAQELRTSVPVSPKRLQEVWDKIGRP